MNLTIDTSFIIVIMLVVSSITLISQILGKIFAKKLFSEIEKSRRFDEESGNHLGTSESYSEVSSVILSRFD